MEEIIYQYRYKLVREWFPHVLAWRANITIVSVYWDLMDEMTRKRLEI